MLPPKSPYVTTYEKRAKGNIASGLCRFFTYTRVHAYSFHRIFESTTRKHKKPVKGPAMLPQRCYPHKKTKKGHTPCQKQDDSLSYPKNNGNNEKRTTAASNKPYKKKASPQHSPHNNSKRSPKKAKKTKSVRYARKHVHNITILVYCDENSPPPYNPPPIQTFFKSRQIIFKSRHLQKFRASAAAPGDSSRKFFFGAISAQMARFRRKWRDFSANDTISAQMPRFRCKWRDPDANDAISRERSLTEPFAILGIDRIGEPQGVGRP